MDKRPHKFNKKVFLFKKYVKNSKTAQDYQNLQFAITGSPDCIRKRTNE